MTKIAEKGKGKLQWHLLDLEFIKGMAVAMDSGAGKYVEGDWKKFADGVAKYHDATMRHIYSAIVDRELDDAETGAPALAHAAASLMILDWHLRREEGDELRQAIQEAILNGSTPLEAELLLKKQNPGGKK